VRFFAELCLGAVSIYVGAVRERRLASESLAVASLQCVYGFSVYC